ncbi:MAG: pyridine nucleotide-disulfide oxidoreductase [Promethearchaeota archaeon]|jgi:peroxiredoxin family protein|nr:MAG: pyridine nucleotide-disulfide oxidoreductase [Candidatus Lokiarchaeota archaeon]
MQKVCFIVGEDSFEKFMMSGILGTTGAALDTEMHFFFTFFGLNLLKKSFRPKVAGMPFPMKRMAAGMFKAKMKKYGVEDMWGLIKDAVQDGKMKLYPCEMTMSLMGIKREQMWEFVEDPVGAASFLEMAEGARIVSL